MARRSSSSLGRFAEMSAPADLKALIEQSGKYKIEKELFEGANAYAFIATHVHLTTSVFLKVYDVDPADPGMFNEPRLLVDATRDPSCPNVVEVRDAERLGADYALVAMQCVDGGSILGRIEHAPFPQADAVEAAVGILMGVAHLHWRNIVHRDVKPSNILLAGGSLLDRPRSLRSRMRRYAHRATARCMYPRKVGRSRANIRGFRTYIRLASCCTR
jgi:serine/threonine protein kinase